MHDAYIISSCIKMEDQIEAIASCGKNILIVGTKTGLLHSYSILNDGSNYKLRFCSFLETADKKPICQMKSVPEENLLFVLTNGVINLYYTGRSLTFTRCFEETKGCNIFAADVKTTTNRLGQTSTRISLCVSNKRVLSFFVWKSERLELLAKQIKLKDEPKALSFMDNIVLIGFKDEYVAYNLASEIQEELKLIEISSSKRNIPCICLIKNSIFGITNDQNLIFKDPNTFSKHEEHLQDKLHKPIKCGGSVLDLVWDEPYVIGRTEKGIEIHVLEDFERPTLVQVIPDLKNVRSLIQSENGVIFAASQTEVWFIGLVDVSLQREVLLEQKKFNLAIELTNLSREESKLETVREIRISYARDLFAKKNFAAAFSEFLKAEANPCDVILLFPTLIKGELKTAESSSRPNMHVLKDEDLENATLALIDYLIAVRQKDIYTKFLSIIDTTLLKCYLQTNDCLVAPLVRRKQCNFQESERILRKHKKINELIILYQVFEEHAKALALLKAQASIEGSSLFGHERTVNYLQNLDKDHKDLVFEYSQWVLAKHPDDGLTIFTNTYCERENNSIPKKEILEFLSKTNQNLVLPYLEHIVYALNDPSPIIHEELIMTYVKQIKKFNEKRNLLRKRNLSELELKELESYRSKLIKILDDSDKYCPERILQLLFPLDNFFNERIQVLKRMNEHEKILFIYIQILGDVEKALEYCEKVQNNDIFEILFQILVNPLKTSPYKGVKLHSNFLEPNLDIVIQVLNKYPMRINPVRVFSLLPGGIPVYRIKNYMEVVYQMNMKNKWHYAILKETLKAELLRLNREIILHRQRNYTLLTESRICKECEKHFSNEQVLVRNHNGDVLHLACFKKNINVD